MLALKPPPGAGTGAGLADLTRPLFDQRLERDTRQPLAVAYSGGGDSLAALIAAKLWADGCGRSVVALHVDHGLQAISADWARRAEQTAAGLGVGFRRLDWLGDKPQSGLPARARAARHALIAEAARAYGARVVVFGHTADDGLEAEAMRAEGSSLGRLAVWRPSPVWPQGRGLFLLRPLLGLRRGELRALLAPFGQAWIEDPANEDPRWLRARVRRRLSDEATEASPPAACDDQPALTDLARAARIDAAGGIVLAREALTGAPASAARRFLSVALVCAGGGQRPPRRERLTALLDKLGQAEPLVATLVGARISAERDILVLRETGSYRRHGAPELRLNPGASAVWDGRFLVENGSFAPVSVRPLTGLFRKLDQKQRSSLSLWQAAARGALPAVIDASGEAICPILAEAGLVTAKELVGERLNGVCGVILKEPTA